MPPVRVTGTKDKTPKPQDRNSTAERNTAHTTSDEAAPIASVVTVNLSTRLRPQHSLIPLKSQQQTTVLIKRNTAVIWVTSSHKKVSTVAINQGMQLLLYPQQAAVPLAAPTAAMDSPSTGRGTTSQKSQTATARWDRGCKLINTR